MKLELTHLLDTCLKRDFAWSSVSVDEVWLSIENPPKRVEAEYSSTLAFEIAAQAKRSNRVVADWEPTDVAERIASAVGESAPLVIGPRVIAPLVIETSTRGHLNVSFGEQWCQSFFESVAAGGGASVVSAERLVTESAPIFAPTDSETGLSPGSIAVFSIRAQPELVSELCEQFRDFLIECGFSNVVKESGLKFKADEAQELPDCLLHVVLARLANPELDSMAIRLGLFGSENIPWLLSEFSRAWRVVARVGERGARRQEIGKIGAATRLAVPTFCGAQEMSVLRAWKEVDFCSAALLWLARSRGAFLTVNGAVNRDYFRRYFSHLMQGIKLFFGFYSHPSNRIAPADSTRLVARLLGEAVEEAARKILLDARSE